MARVTVSFVLLLGVYGCHLGATDVEQPFYRFADPEPDVSLSAGPPHNTSAKRPVATIRDDTRYVLDAPPSALVLMRRGMPVYAGKKVELTARIPEVLRGHDRIVLLPQIKTRFGWQRLGPQVVAPQPRLAMPPTLNVTLDWLAKADSRVNISVWGYAVAPAASTEHRTPNIHLPKDAHLEFSTGIIEPGWSGGAVSFSVSVCEEQRCSRVFDETLDPRTPAGRSWRNHRIDLARWENQARFLSFETRLVENSGDQISFPVWGNPTVYAVGPRPRKTTPNVILVSLDTLRADHLTSYGHKHDTAPVMHQLFSREGVVFENLVAAATTTTPSHMTIFTALNPIIHGLKTGLESLTPSITTLAEVLRAHGVETGAVTENGWLGIRHGFSRGFNTYVENKSPDIMSPTGQVDATISKALKWLEAVKDRQFFLFLHTFQVHDPYVPPREYAHLFREGDNSDKDPLAHKRSPNLYDREIRYTDKELERLFSFLETSKLSENTVVIITSDHGEEFAEHGLLGHGPHLYEEVQKVPLLIMGPGIPRGERIPQPVGHWDLMPTILELTGLEPPLGLQGSSLLPLLSGQQERHWRTRPVYGEAWQKSGRKPDTTIIRVLAPAFSVRIGNRKLHRYRTDRGYRYEYFDLETDPHETDNLFAARGDEANDLVELIDSYESTALETRKKVGARTGETSGRPPSELIDPAREEKLRALGYIQ